MRTAAADAVTASVSAAGISISAKNPGKWGNEIKVTAVAATKGKTAVLEATGDEATGKVYTVANGSIFAEGDTIVIRNNGKVTGTGKYHYSGTAGKRRPGGQVPGSEKSALHL